MKTGLIGGKFLPLHNGHLYFINKAATMVDKLYVVVSEADSDRPLMEKAGLKYPDLLERVRWLSMIFKDAPHIEIVAMSERGMKPYPDGWEEWSEAILEKVGDKVTHIFTSDDKYREGFKKHFPDMEHIFFDEDRHQTDGLSATKVRDNINKYWFKLPKVVREFYAKKVCIVGGESVGKTTLSRAMAKAFGTSHSEECGRIFCEEVLGEYFDKNGFIKMNKDDYENVLIEQSIQNKQKLSEANKFVIIDTDAIYTQNFYMEQFGEKSEIAEQFIKKQMKDYIYIYLSDDVEFVQDGNRTGKTKNKIKQFYLNYIPKFHFEINLKTYKERYDKLHDILKGLSDE